MALNAVEWTGRALRRAGSELLRRSGIQGTWIDVGAYQGAITLPQARRNPALRVYAVEPNLRLAAKLLDQSPNYHVIPVAVAETNGCATFHLNAFEGASSLLPMNEQGLRSWIGGEALRVDATVTVPTVRLDTLMGLLGIEKVDFLKVDAQGADLSVVKSAGSRLRDIEKIVLEVDVAPQPLYLGVPSKDAVVSFLNEAGFELVSMEKQSHGQEENLTFRRLAVR